MADTPKSRTAGLALINDNDNYEVTAQDMRDVIVSLWPAERESAEDYFSGPQTGQVTADLEWRGDYFQGTAASAVTQGQVLALNASGEYVLADAANLATAMAVAIACSTIAAAGTGLMMRAGLMYLSGICSGYTIGQQVYLASGTGGGLTQTKPTNVQVLGVVEAAGKLRFEPSWATV